MLAAIVPSFLIETTPNAESVAFVPSELGTPTAVVRNAPHAEFTFVSVTPPAVEKHAVAVGLPVPLAEGVVLSTSDPVANVEAELVTVAVNEANVPAPKAEPASETSSTAKRSFLTVVTDPVSARGGSDNMGASGGWVWERLNGR